MNPAPAMAPHHETAPQALSDAIGAGTLGLIGVAGDRTVDTAALRLWTAELFDRAPTLAWRAGVDRGGRLRLLPVRLDGATLICIDIDDPNGTCVRVPAWAVLPAELERSLMARFSLESVLRTAGAPTGVDTVAGQLGVGSDDLARLFDQVRVRKDLQDVAYDLRVERHDTPSLEWALWRLHGSIISAPPGLVPLLAVDDTSLACFDFESERVVRWHLGDVPERAQGRVLDTDAGSFLASWAEELAARLPGLQRMGEVAERAGHLAEGKVPRGHELRPIRLASQNVIVGLAAIRHDARWEALDVQAFQTCEVPHLATHEPNRALATLVLCDAFRNGGTMEIRFDRHPERRVPASLRRYARAVGIELGAEEQAVITPEEARALFMAVTPMPSVLGNRVLSFCAASGIRPERLCYMLLEGIWSAVELEALLAWSEHAASVLRGGTDALARPDRQAEVVVGRAALMVGMLVRVLQARSSSAHGGGTILEEGGPEPIKWEILSQPPAVRLQGLEPGPLPWGDGWAGENVTVLPRPWVLPSTITEVDAVEALGHEAYVLLPKDAIAPGEAMRLLRCPDDRAALDRQVDARLARAEVGRK